MIIPSHKKKSRSKKYFFISVFFLEKIFFNFFPKILRFSKFQNFDFQNLVDFPENFPKCQQQKKTDFFSIWKNLFFRFLSRGTGVKHPLNMFLAPITISDAPWTPKQINIGFVKRCLGPQIPPTGPGSMKPSANKGRYLGKSMFFTMCRAVLCVTCGMEIA